MPRLVGAGDEVGSSLLPLSLRAVGSSSAQEEVLFEVGEPFQHVGVGIAPVGTFRLPGRSPLLLSF
ncbi:MAG: hypothetical protein R2825_15710 [Saprospiraceae bacterium]